MLRRGFTFIEMMIALAMSMLIIGSIGSAFAVTMHYQRTTPERLNQFQDNLTARRSLDTLFDGIYVSADEADLLSYFIAADSTGQSSIANGLTFTTLSKPLEGGYLLSDSVDSQELHEIYGPVGGLSEVSISVTPVGDPGDDRSGLFVRIQTPSDGDPTQGGLEQLLIPGVISIDYEFWDGSQWLQAWDTVNGGSRRIPPAVRMTLNYDEGEPEYMTFKIPGSDVTIENPIVQTTEGAPTGP